MAKKEIDDRFQKFGTVSFAEVTRVNDFIDFLEQGKLMGTVCKQCKKRFFPPRADCFHSLSGDMEWFEVTGTGKLVSFSSLEYAPTGFEEDLPYTIALLDYGDYKVFGRLDSSVPLEDVAIGMEMKAVVNELPNEQLNYVFQKA